MEHFKRSIEIDVTVEGNRLESVSRLTDEYHAMELRLAIDLPTETIVEATAAMTRFPYAPCPGSISSVGGAVGVKIDPGIKKTFRKAIPKQTGCAHISELADNTFDFLLQKLYWDGVGRNIENREEWEKATFGYLNSLGTCHTFNAARNFTPKPHEFLPRAAPAPASDPEPRDL